VSNSSRNVLEKLVIDLEKKSKLSLQDKLNLETYKKHLILIKLDGLKGLTKSELQQKISILEEAYEYVNHLLIEYQHNRVLANFSRHDKSYDTGKRGKHKEMKANAEIVFKDMRPKFLKKTEGDFCLEFVKKVVGKKICSDTCARNYFRDFSRNLKKL